MEQIDKFNLNTLIKIDQMHDEIINEITLEQNQIIFDFNSLHFFHKKNANRCRLTFTDLDDIDSSAYIDVFKKKKLYR